MEQATLSANIRLAGKAKFRRAGLGFKEGENQVLVTEKQLAMLEQEPALTVLAVSDRRALAGDDIDDVVVDASESSPDSTSLDLSRLSPEVASIVAMIHEQVLAGQLKKTQSGVPDTAALEAAFETANGDKIQISAKLRDEAWSEYQALMANEKGDA